MNGVIAIGVMTKIANTNTNIAQRAVKNGLN